MQLAALVVPTGIPSTSSDYRYSSAAASGVPGYEIDPCGLTGLSQ